VIQWQPIPSGSLLRGRYEVQVLLGRGGFGATYKVLDKERFNEPCALKELLPTQAENPKVRELFEREARTLLALRHPGIPALHHFYVDADRYYLVQDFVAGETLAQELERRGPFGEGEVIQIIEETLAILEHLHGRTPSVIHRDIKPANLIRSDSGQLYLIDFGAVKEEVRRTALGPESTIIGTSGYTPPEQLRGNVCAASDLYALGATALHLVSGRPPAEWYDVLQGKWRFEGRLRVSAHLEAVLMRLLKEQVAQRFQSAREVFSALKGTVVEEPRSDLGSEGVKSGGQTDRLRAETVRQTAAAIQAFENVWYRPDESRWSDNLKLRAFTDAGRLIVYAHSLEFQGTKERVVITHVRRISLVRQGRDLVNKWVKIEYGEGAPLTAFFADGSLLGWGGLTGGTDRILAAVRHLTE